MLDRLQSSAGALMIRLIALSLLITFSTDCQAQTSTVCRNVYGVVYCDTNQPANQGMTPPNYDVPAANVGNRFLEGYASGAALGASINAQNAARKAAEDRAAADALAARRLSDTIASENAAVSRRQEVGRLVALGQCQDAIGMALGAGDFDLAQRAKQFCSPEK